MVAANAVISMSTPKRERETMEHRFLGRTGLRVSELCLGTMTFGREADEAASHAMLDQFVAAGGTFIDTADVYGRGKSEEIVGRWLTRQTRDDYVVATKVRFPMGDGPNDAGTSRKHIMAGIDASLKRLQTDYVDLYQVHCWDPVTPLEETLDTLNDLVRAGKVRYIGASNFAGYQLQRAADLSRVNNTARFVCLQPQYNLLVRQIEWEVLPVCIDEGIGVIPWSPLKGGWLSGKFRRGMETPPEDTRIGSQQTGGENWRSNNNEYTWNVLDALFAAASAVDKSPAQVALRWLLQQPAVTAPIIGARNAEQLSDNLNATGWTLTAEQMTPLTEASNVPLPYPYSFITSAAERR